MTISRNSNYPPSHRPTSTRDLDRIARRIHPFAATGGKAVLAFSPSLVFNAAMPSTNQPAPPQRKWDFDRVFRLILSIITIVALFMLVRFLSDVLIPFAVALLLAFLLNPIVTAIDSRLERRTLSVLITVFGTGVVAAAVMLMLFYIGGREISSLQQLVQDFARGSNVGGVQHIGEAFDNYVDRIENDTVRQYLIETRDHIRENREKYLTSLQPSNVVDWFMSTVAPWLVGVVSGVLGFILGITGLVVIVLYLVFLLIDYPLMARTWRGFLPPKQRDDIIGFLDEFRLAMSLYFRGQFIIAMIVGVLFAIAFKLIDLRMAILLGLTIGMLNMVPYLQIVGMVPALLLGFVRGLESGGRVWLPPLLVFLSFCVVQTIQDAVLTPRILGKSVGLRPVLLLLGVFIWGKLLGFLGVVLAIPLTCLGLAYYKRFVLGDLAARAIEPETESA